jgi:hypothetical protein
LPVQSAVRLNPSLNNCAAGAVIGTGIDVSRATSTTVSRSFGMLRGFLQKLEV